MEELAGCEAVGGEEFESATGVKDLVVNYGSKSAVDGLGVMVSRGSVWLFNRNAY